MGSFKRTFALICFLTSFAFSHAQNSPQAYLDAHNRARAEVGVGPLSWSATLANYAQNYANQRSGDCSLVHSGGPYGENIAWSSGGSFTATDAVNLWVGEKTSYDHATNTCAEGKVCGHYTQVVWRNSNELGCARVQCASNRGVFVICSYNPRGNYVGQSPY